MEQVGHDDIFFGCWTTHYCEQERTLFDILLLSMKEDDIYGQLIII